MTESVRTHWLLIHSPLVGPFTWEPVAEALRGRGMRVLVPTLARPETSSVQFWREHVDSVVAQVATEPRDTRYVLAGHSGAGVLLPAIGRELEGRVAAYLFVDAGLPRGGQPRMEGQFGELLKDLYARGERFPNWTDEALAGILPDPAIRARVIDELRPQALAFWEEALPDIDGWPDAPCGYMHFSPAYDEDAERARSLGWPVHATSAGHFHMLVEPGEVADALLRLVDELGVLVGDG
jgi:hypothetical protein